MSVIVDIDEQYCDELCCGYQLIAEDDGTYTVWVSTGLISGYRSGGSWQSLPDAFNHLVSLVRENEYF